ncbi:MAG: asparagine synthetase A [Nitrososphaeria archaeon]|nr:asparagine synthetase A [Nitrososphaeria archaeon]
MKGLVEEFDPERVALIREPMDERRLAIFRVQGMVLKTMVDILLSKGFYWFLPVILSRATDPLWPDPDFSIEKRIEVEIYGKTVRAMQSMIVHKRVLVSLGPEKFFILSPNIRIERSERAKTGKHLYEFTQLEIEVAYAKMQEIFKIYEELITKSIDAVRKTMKDELEILKRDLHNPEIPFKIYKRSVLEEKYGNNWQEKIASESKDPVWVTDIPREFYDYEDEETGEWRNFDLILPEGYGEVISGAEREYEYEKILKKLKRDKIDVKQYQILLDLSRDGKLKPSAGAGLGVERFIAYLVGAKHVAEVQPFPRIPGIVPEI